MFNPFSAFFAFFGIVAFMIIAGAIALFVFTIVVITRGIAASKGTSPSTNRSHTDQSTAFPLIRSTHAMGANAAHVLSTPIVTEGNPIELPHSHAHDVHAHHHGHEHNPGTSAIVDAVGIGLGAAAGIEIGAAIEASTQAWTAPDNSSQPVSFDPGPTFTDSSVFYSAPTDTSSMSTPSVDTSGTSGY